MRRLRTAYHVANCLLFAAVALHVVGTFVARWLSDSPGPLPPPEPVLLWACVWVVACGLLDDALDDLRSARRRTSRPAPLPAASGAKPAEPGPIPR